MSRAPHGLVVLAALLSLACGGEESAPPAAPEPAGSGEAVLTENARLLDDVDALSSVTREGDMYRLQLARTSPVLQSLEAGDVLIVGVTEHTPHGALFAIDGVAEGGDGLEVTAHAAQLGEAFEKLELSLAASLGLGGPGSVTTQGGYGEPLGSAQQSLGVSLPINLSAGSGDDSLTFDGSLALDPDAKLELDFDFETLQLNELSLSLTARETFVASVVGRGQLSFDEPVHLGDIALQPIVITIPVPGIGALPVVITPGISLDAGITGSIAGDAEWGVTQRASFTAGIGYVDGEFQAFSEDESDFDSEDPTYTANASIRAWAGPKLEVLIYGAVGPFAGVQGFVQASASVAGDPPCVTGAIDAGLRADAGVKFLADYSTQLFEERYRLAGFDSCDPELDGPDAATTWSRTYGREGSPGERAQAVLQASDGGYFVVGESGAFDGVTGFAAATWAMRLDALGNVLWQRAFQRTEQGLARAAAQVPGGFLIGGSTGVLKVDSGGNLLWAKKYEAEGELELTTLAADEDGNTVVAGVLGLSSAAFALELDRSGNVNWSRSFGGTVFRSARKTADGGTLLSGSAEGADGDMYVVKLNRQGDVDWQRGIDNRYDGRLGVPEAEPDLRSSIDAAYDAVEKPDGSIFVVGESYGAYPIPEAGSVGYFTSAELELDSAGELLVSRVSRAPDDALYGGATSALVRPNGSTLVLARGASEVDDLLSNEDVLVMQSGAFRRLGGSGNDYVYSGTLAGPGRGAPLQLTEDGGAIAALTSNSFSEQDEVWLVKLSRTGDIDAPFCGTQAGSSYDNEQAVSVELRSPPQDIDVTVTTFTADVRSEATSLVTRSVSP